ncbi:hypothetical protein SLEP1_g41898 [Rubroshorea leprosula]|uniref:Uncharacterized protein n=1 Tax=Rubroshorea leprosula TaxID=152421 RepID=A0AAV5L858_9ROSI|nr:hypothetical protein SLEP1_g41898 [Rubroshorea leprosula]
MDSKGYSFLFKFLVIGPLNASLKEFCDVLYCQYSFIING